MAHPRQSSAWLASRFTFTCFPPAIICIYSHIKCAVRVLVLITALKQTIYLRFDMQFFSSTHFVPSLMITDAWLITSTTPTCTISSTGSSTQNQSTLLLSKGAFSSGVVRSDGDRFRGFALVSHLSQSESTWMLSGCHCRFQEVTVIPIAFHESYRTTNVLQWIDNMTHAHALKFCSSGSQA